MKPRILIASILTIFTLLTASAQKNVVKWNVSSLAFKNAYFTYERAFEKKFSLNLGVGFVPSSTLLFGSLVPDVKSGDIERESPIKNMSMTGYSITPEFRYYTSLIKETPRGLYVSAYLRHSNYNLTLNDYDYVYKDEFDNNIEKTAKIDFNSTITSIGGGIMLGHQWILAEHVSIDLWFIGLGLNSSTFKLKATDKDKSMNPLYFTSTSTFAKDTQEYFSALGTVDVSSNQPNHYVETNITRLMPALRGLGFNIGVAF